MWILGPGHAVHSGHRRPSEEVQSPLPGLLPDTAWRGQGGESARASSDTPQPVGAAPRYGQYAHRAGVFPDFKRDDSPARARDCAETGRDLISLGSTVRVLRQGIHVSVESGHLLEHGAGGRMFEQESRNPGDVPVYERMTDYPKPCHLRSALPTSFREPWRSLPARTPRTLRPASPHGGGSRRSWHPAWLCVR